MLQSTQRVAGDAEPIGGQADLSLAMAGNLQVPDKYLGGSYALVTFETLTNYSLFVPRGTRSLQTPGLCQRYSVQPERVCNEYMPVHFYCLYLSEVVMTWFTTACTTQAVGTSHLSMLSSLHFVLLHISV